MADALNHYNAILSGPNPIHVKIGTKYYVPFPLNIQNSPIRPFHPDVIDSITYRRLLTEKNKARAAVYAIAANLCSAVFGLWLIDPLWHFIVSIS